MRRYNKYNARKISSDDMKKNSEDNLHGAVFVGLTYDFDIFKDTLLNVLQNPKDFGISQSQSK